MNSIVEYYNFYLHISYHNLMIYFLLKYIKLIINYILIYKFIKYKFFIIRKLNICVKK